MSFMLIYLLLIHIELFPLTASPIQANKCNKALLGIAVNSQTEDNKVPGGKKYIIPVTNMGDHVVCEGDKHKDVVGMVPLKDFHLEMVPLKTFLEHHPLPSHVKLMLMNCNNTILKN